MTSEALKHAALVIEDDEVCANLLGRLLAPYFKVKVATFGREGLEQFAQALETRLPFSLICLDIMLPDIDGQEILRSIRELEARAGIPPEKAVPIVITSGVDDFKTIMTAFRDKCQAYLVKPFDKFKLYQELRQLHLLPPEVP